MGMLPRILTQATLTRGPEPRSRPKIVETYERDKLSPFSWGNEPMKRCAGLILAGMMLGLRAAVGAQTPPRPVPKPANSAPRPKLVVVIVVDQMRADSIEKFRGQWTGGLKRLVEQGAWFREAAYPYAATETCVGHATISTGALPAMSGMVANAWWDRESQQMVTCTADAKAKNSGYAGTAAKG